LGLSLVKHFVEMLGGRISISSVQHKGTRVTFSLPVTNYSDESTIKKFATFYVWGVETEEPLAPALSKQLHLSRLASKILPLSEAVFTCQQTPKAELADIIVVVGQKLTQNMAYFARTMAAHPQFQKIFLVLVIAPEQYEFDCDQAYASGYHAVLSASKYLLFTQSLHEVWETWKRRKEQEMRIKQNKSHDKILVIEDHPMNQAVIEMLLRELGLKVDIAADGKSGLKAIEQNAYDAVLLDMGLPDITGLEVVKTIRERSDNKKDLPIIIVTAGGHTETVQEIKSQQVDGYLLKPITVAQLRDILSPFVKINEAA